jgi:hypothetical protein
MPDRSAAAAGLLAAPSPSQRASDWLLPATRPEKGPGAVSANPRPGFTSPQEVSRWTIAVAPTTTISARSTPGARRRP